MTPWPVACPRRVDPDGRAMSTSMLTLSPPRPRRPSGTVCSGVTGSFRTLRAHSLPPGHHAGGAWNTRISRSSIAVFTWNELGRRPGRRRPSRFHVEPCVFASPPGRVSSARCFTWNATGAGVSTTAPGPARPRRPRPPDASGRPFHVERRPQVDGNDAGISAARSLRAGRSPPALDRGSLAAQRDLIRRTGQRGCDAEGSAEPGQLDDLSCAGRAPGSAG